ncbi:MAG TPA: response regulator transcription factor [Mycobacteriales bacterium]|nr:response regulator transcription factor [Mycobacteriales bacterium]
MINADGAGHRPRRVLIVDHNAAFASRLRLALTGVADLECVGAACTAAQAYPVVERTAPDVVVIDMMLRGRTGLALIRRLRTEHGHLALVVTSTSPDLGKLMAATVAGANGFAPKKGATEELLSVLRSARPGAMSIAPSLLPAARAGVTDWYPGRLTARESHVLELLSRGAGAAEIARILTISPVTALSHLRSIRGKLGVSTGPDAVDRARQLGLLDPARIA